MKKFVLTFFFVAFSIFSSVASDTGILITKSGDSLKVYNIDIAALSVYYTLIDDVNTPIFKICKSDLLMIQMADGVRLIFDECETPVVPENKQNQINHYPTTHEAASDFNSDKKGNRIIAVKDGYGQILHMRLVPNEDKTLAVTKWHGKGKYDREYYVIPEYVTVKDEIYTVRYIDDRAFDQGTNKNIKDIVFPSTLKTIGSRAFAFNLGLERIVLPDSIEVVGKEAFIYCGCNSSFFEQLYIPKTIKKIGENSFLSVSPSTSFRGFFQGNLTSIPLFITISNCKFFGIDEEAIEAYENKLK